MARGPHAEVNALLTAAHAGAEVRRCAVYTTLEPCPLCIGAIRISDMQTVHHMTPDPVAGGLALLELIDSCGAARSILPGSPVPSKPPETAGKNMVKPSAAW